MTRLADLLSRQHVEHVKPRIPVWSRLLVIAVFCLLAWVLTLIFAGGIAFWIEALR